MNVKRSRHIAFTLDDFALFRFIPADVEALPRCELTVFSALSRQSLSIPIDGLRFLYEIPSERWILRPTLDAISRELFDEFVKHGFIFCDPHSAESAKYYSKENLVVQAGWPRDSFVSHARTVWLNAQARFGDYGKLDEEGEFIENKFDRRSVLAERNSAPLHFFSVQGALNRVPLQKQTLHRSSDLSQALKKRRSRRSFSKEPITISALGTVLHAVFGYSVRFPILPNVTVLRKSSPSAGSLHITECFVLAINISDINPGVYHYNVEYNSLDAISELTDTESLDLSQGILGGQYFARGAAAVIILSSRFDRLFWKYRGNLKAYNASSFDIGHISQTLQIIASDNGLGSVFCGAISDENADEALGLDGVTHTARSAICIGVPSEQFVANLERDPSGGTILE